MQLGKQKRLSNTTKYYENYYQYMKNITIPKQLDIDLFAQKLSTFFK